MEKEVNTLKESEDINSYKVINNDCSINHEKRIVNQKKCKDNYEWNSPEHNEKKWKKQNKKVKRARIDIEKDEIKHIN